MKNKYPAYRLTQWLSGLDEHLESWFEHFNELGSPVAIVEKILNEAHQYTKKPVAYRRFSIWVIGVESIGNEMVHNHNEEIIEGKILKEANGFKDALNKRLNKQKLDRQREEQLKGDINDYAKNA